MRFHRPSQTMGNKCARDQGVASTIELPVGPWMAGGGDDDGDKGEYIIEMMPLEVGNASTKVPSTRGLPNSILCAKLVLSNCKKHQIK